MIWSQPTRTCAVWQPPNSPCFQKHSVSHWALYPLMSSFAEIGVAKHLSKEFHVWQWRLHWWKSLFVCLFQTWNEAVALATKVVRKVFLGDLSRVGVGSSDPFTILTCFCCEPLICLTQNCASASCKLKTKAGRARKCVEWVGWVC